MGSSIVKELYDAGKLPGLPKFVPTNMVMEVVGGSVSYGVSGEFSDWDIVGVCIPSKAELFPSIFNDVIPGFGKQKKRFSTYQQHHISYKEKDYDITIYNIVDFFNKCKDMSPNMVDVLYVPDNCVLHITQIGNLIRENRSMFLNKKCWQSFKGYAYSMQKKMENKDPEEGSKRDKLIEEFKFDVKYGYHLVRLMSEVEQLLATGDMDIQLDRERLKAIRRGEWTMQQIKDFFTYKEKSLEELYNSSTLPYSPDEAKIKALLRRCINMHYDDMSKHIVVPGKAEAALRAIRDICDDVNL